MGATLRPGLMACMTHFSGTNSPWSWNSWFFADCARRSVYLVDEPRFVHANVRISPRLACMQFPRVSRQISAMGRGGSSESDISKVPRSQPPLSLPHSGSCVIRDPSTFRFQRKTIEASCNRFFPPRVTSADLRLRTPSSQKIPQISRMRRPLYGDDSRRIFS